MDDKELPENMMADDDINDTDAKEINQADEVPASNTGGTDTSLVQSPSSSDADTLTTASSETSTTVTTQLNTNMNTGMPVEAVKMEIQSPPVQPLKRDLSTDKQTLMAVLAFLKKNNFKETEQLLVKEAGVDKIEEELATTESADVTAVLTAAATPPAATSTASLSTVVFKSEIDSKGDIAVYSDQYRSLVQFIDNSLDNHKFEQASLLFPVFVHIYLSLVASGLEEQAKSYFEEFNTVQEYYHERDLINLAAVTKPEHLRDNQILQEYKSSQYTVHMSRESYNHVKRFLTDRGHSTLLTILQDHLFIDVFDGASRSKQQIDATAGAMLGTAARDANTVRVFYGLLKEPDITIQADEEDQQQQQQSAGNNTEDNNKSSSKRKKSRKDPMLTKKSKNDPNAPLPTRIPLPHVRDADKLERVRAFRESAKRVKLSADNLPSICFYTFMNTLHSVTTVEICEDSSMLAAGFSNSLIRVWSLNSNKLTTLKSADDLNLLDRESDDVLDRIMDDRDATDSRMLRGHTGPVFSISFSHDRTLLISGSEDGTVRLWSLLTWSNVVCYKGHIYPVWSVKFGPYGHYFVSAGADRTARLWCMDHPQPLRIFAGHLSDVDSIEFHPNSNYIATGSTDRTVRLWDLATGSSVRNMTGHKAAVLVLSFCSNGRHLASAGADKLVIVWDISFGEMLAVLTGHTDTVYSLAFSRDLSILASGGGDNVVKLWDVSQQLSDIESATDTALINNNLQSNANSTPSTGGSVKELSSYRTKSTSVLCLHFTRRNLLLAAGSFTCPNNPSIAQ